jgi:hypothetical protein
MLEPEIKIGENLLVGKSVIIKVKGYHNRTNIVAALINEGYTVRVIEQESNYSTRIESYYVEFWID